MRSGDSAVRALKEDCSGRSECFGSRCRGENREEKRERERETGARREKLEKKIASPRGVRQPIENSSLPGFAQVFQSP